MRGFKTGNSFYKNRTQKRGFKKGHSFLGNKKKNGSGSDSEQSTIQQKITRSMSQKSKEMEDKRDYFILPKGHLEQMYNTAMHEHQQHSSCNSPHFEINKHSQAAISVTLFITCKKCKYKSAPFKMFDEMTTKSRGRKPSTLNRALGFALLHFSMGATTFYELCFRLGIDAGSVRGITNILNACTKQMELLAEENMAAERKKFVGKDPISVSCDTRYNNPISSGNTPFQSGTQAVFTVTENETPKKKILDVGCFSKLCPIGTRMQQENPNITCPGHENCTANLNAGDPIGFEGKYATISAKKLKEEGVQIKAVTTDGDSNIAKGFTDVYDEEIERFNDPSHSDRRLKRSIKTATFSKVMFPGNKQERTRAISSFSEEIKRRCRSELSAAKNKLTIHKKKAKSEDFQLRDKLKVALQNTPDAIIQCYKGSHTFCDKHSFVCSRKNRYDKSLLPTGIQRSMSMTEADEGELNSIIIKHMGPDAISHSYKNTSTQKNEALNRAFSKSNPKLITSSRTFVGRIGASVLVNNLGLEEEVHITQKSSQHVVSQTLKTKIGKEYQHRKRLQNLQKEPSHKKRRSTLTSQKYKLHQKLHPEPGYSKGKYAG